jgi:hypothetical protein
MSFKGVGAGGTIEAELLEAELDELAALGQELVPSGSS